MVRAERTRTAAGFTALLPLRGILLWFFLPAALLIWPFAALVVAARGHRGLSPRECLRFVDDLVTSGLSNTVLRPLLGRAPWPWQDGGRGLGGPSIPGLH